MQNHFSKVPLQISLHRSEKDKRSPYAPEEGYRYDGIYRVEKCWRIAGMQVWHFILVQAFHFSISFAHFLIVNFYFVSGVHCLQIFACEM